MTEHGCENVVVGMKNDIKDARVIAQLIKDGRCALPNIPQGIYADGENGAIEMIEATCQSKPGK